MKYTIKNPNPFPLSAIGIRTKTEVGLGREWADDYGIETEALIIAGLDGPPEQETRLGHVRAIVLTNSQVQNVRESCEDIDPVLLVLHDALYDENENLRPKFETLTDGYTGDICWIKEVFLEPQYRGYGLGLLAVDGLIRSMPSMDQGCFVLSPRSMDGNLDAQQKLTWYWQRMGFEYWVQRDGVPFMGMCLKYGRPGMRGVVPRLV